MTGLRNWDFRDSGLSALQSLLWQRARVLRGLGLIKSTAQSVGSSSFEEMGHYRCHRVEAPSGAQSEPFDVAKAGTLKNITENELIPRGHIFFYVWGFGVVFRPVKRNRQATVTMLVPTIRIRPAPATKTTQRLDARYVSMAVLARTMYTRTPARAPDRQFTLTTP